MNRKQYIKLTILRVIHSIGKMRLMVTNKKLPVTSERGIIQLSNSTMTSYVYLEFNITIFLLCNFKPFGKLLIFAAIPVHKANNGRDTRCAGQTSPPNWLYVRSTLWN